MNPGVRRAALRTALAPLLLLALPAAALLWWGRSHLHGVTEGVLIALGVFGFWRYSWLFINYWRAGTYARRHYPKLRAAAQAAAGSRPWPKRIYVVVATYLEEPWVTVECFQALMGNLADIPCDATIVAAAGSEQDEALIASIYKAHPARDRIELVLQRQSRGKRIALGHALRAVARRYEDEPDSATVIMDGDSWLEPGTLERCLPFFFAFRDLGALTTNEVAFIPGQDAWYRDWFALKFGQRHVLFQSHSLSHKVLTLTGRFSVFRTSIVVQEDFAAMIERDVASHWLHGDVPFLMGDDKSSWFYLLRQGWNMLYLPDVTVCSLEARTTDFLQASVSLPYRWFGNTLRNNPRALALGPARTGWFIWFAILDQRLTMWTSLVGITGALALAMVKSFLYLPLYLAWAVIVRCLQLFVIAFHGHAVTLRSVPIMLYTQWLGALMKIHAWYHVDQSWSKGKTQQARTHRLSWRQVLAGGVMVLSTIAFATLVMLAHSVIRWPNINVFAATLPTPMVDAATRGVVAGDGKDDAEALQALLEGAQGPLVVRLPAGQLDFHRPVVIRRSDVSVLGAGQGQTRIVSHLRGDASAVLSVQGARGNVVARLARPLSADETTLTLDKPVNLRAGDFVWLRQPNDDALFEQLGSAQWRREQPYLRQTMLRVVSAQGPSVSVEGAAGIPYAAAATEVMHTRPVQRVRLAGFTIEQRVPGRDIAQVRLRYENTAPDVPVDGISLDGTADVVIEDVAVLAAGRHPVVIERSYGFALRRCELAGAWNKGEGGNGYLRIARSYRGVVEDCTIRDIRHIALQWSAGFNRLERITSGVDVNFHGGYSHHNVARDIRFDIPAGHPWPPVFVTPQNARWAPPDGPGNAVLTASPGNRAPSAPAASRSR